MKRPLVLALLVCGPLAANDALAAETLLKPVSPWNVEWKDKTCTLSRAFGTMEDPLILRLERFAPGDRFQIVLVGKALANARKGRTFTISYGAGKPVDVSESFMFGASNDHVPTVFISSGTLREDDGIVLKGEALWTAEVPKVTPEREAAVKSLSLRFSGKSLTLDTGPMAKAFAALRQCTDDLVKQWGLDPAVQATLQRFPVPVDNPANWLKSGDYPHQALLERKSALVAFRLSVDASGTPTACDIQRAYADTNFRTITCKSLIARARFKPALDADGAPTPSYYVNTVQWVMY